jgi:hypothetical protein
LWIGLHAGFSLLLIVAAIAKNAAAFAEYAGTPTRILGECGYILGGSRLWRTIPPIKGICKPRHGVTLKVAPYKHFACNNGKEQ